MLPELPLKDLFNKENSIMDKNNRDVQLQKNQRGEFLDNTQPGTRQNPSQERENGIFKKIFDSASVSDSNHDKRKKAVSCDGEIKKAGQDSTVGFNRELLEHEVKNQNILANESIKNVKSFHNINIFKRDAIDIIKRSLLNISDMINLNVTAYPAFNENKIPGFSEYGIEQISEIICCLKGLTDLLDGAVKNNISIEMKGISVNPEYAAKLFKDLRSEIFKLETAFRMAGIAEEVSGKVAEKMGKPFTDGGIPQAVDPQSLSMPESQLRQLFDNQRQGSQKQMDDIISRIIALVKEEDKSDISNKKLLVINGLKSGNKVIAENSTENHSINSQVLRRLLKINGDVEPNQGGQGRDADSDEKRKKTGISNIFLSTKGSMKHNIKEIFTAAKDSSDTLPGIEASIKNQGQVTVDLNSKITSVIPRSLEESVITQVTQRFQSAVKNGIHEIRLVLRPQSLGDVRMTIQMEGDIVTARIQVDSQQVKQIIESNLNNLKDSLEEQNLQTGSFDVNVNRNSRDGEQSFEESAEKSNSSEKNVDKGTDRPDGNNKSSGINTGRKFGSNSVEFYA